MSNIPHLIHYFWFGNSPKPDLVKKCIESWRTFCPDFEIKEWNESNYDVNSHPFMKKAYEEKKWAFVTDYARLDILYKYGGIYLDTDVEILKDFSPLCMHKAYMGFERDDVVGDGAGMGFSPGMPILKEMMACYDNLDDYIESPKLRTQILIRHGLKQDGKKQCISEVVVYPVDFFCPKSFSTGKLKITENTYSIHHFKGSWHSQRGLAYLSVMRTLNAVFGEEIGMNIYHALISIKDCIRNK